MARRHDFGLSKEEREEAAALHRTGESALNISRHLGVSAASVADYIEYYDLRQFKKAADGVAGLVFVLGLVALLFAGLPLPFWPGILFVFGLSALVDGFARLHRASNAQTVIWTFGLGLMLMPGVNFSLGGVLVLIVFSMIAGALFRNRFDRIAEAEEKHEEKHEDEDDEHEDDDERPDWRKIRREIGDEIRREIRRELRDEEQVTKRKNEDLARDGEKPKRGATPGRLMLSDDGELIEAVDVDVDTGDEDDVPIRRASRRG
ncbi:MAG: helix-turn-helix domain-containing protein [Anaerolineae bacterium]|nr:helix-turn-helix domain-containing protein [Anaerolineae bacterium]